ncbi:hypothetical protein ACS25B_07200 [Dickeya dadantii subsp. dieffenbachiae]|nr:hypothetical protein [Dickeya dadantii]
MQENLLDTPPGTVAPGLIRLEQVSRAYPSAAASHPILHSVSLR